MAVKIFFCYAHRAGEQVYYSCHHRRGVEHGTTADHREHVVLWRQP
jgi:hypothetical protein